jgi:hypothetical protein
MAAVEALVATRTPPSEMSDEPGCPVADPSLLDGDWECVMSTKQLFRSSPFFMAIQAGRRSAKRRSGVYDLGYRV